MVWGRLILRDIFLYNRPRCKCTFQPQRPTRPQCYRLTMLAIGNLSSSQIKQYWQIIIFRQRHKQHKLPDTSIHVPYINQQNFVKSDFLSHRNSRKLIELLKKLIHI